MDKIADSIANLQSEQSVFIVGLKSADDMLERLKSRGVTTMAEEKSDKNGKRIGFLFHLHAHHSIHQPVISATIEKEVEESRKTKFINHKLSYSFGIKNRKLLHGSEIETYEAFEIEYNLIQKKESKLSAKLRKEIVDTWVFLYGKN